MLKRILALAVFSTASAIGLVSAVSTVVSNFVEPSSSSNSNREKVVLSKTATLPTQPILVAQSTTLTGKWKADDGGVYTEVKGLARNSLVGAIKNG